MNIFGIVCECNPFHNGHAYCIDQAKAMGADAVILAMSGDFVQRGEPAIFDHYTRSAAAVAYGADLVLKIPLPYCLSSAQFYAQAGVSILKAAGITHLLFGSESGNLSSLQQVASTMTTPYYQGQLKQLLSNNLSYPRARAKALALCEVDSAPLSNPNDTLAVEYILALGRSNIQPISVLRRQVDHHSTIPGSNTASATYLRQQLLQGQDISDYVPANSCVVPPANPCALDKVLLCNLLHATPASLANTAFCQNGLGNRLQLQLSGCTSIHQLVQRCTSNQITAARVRRAIWAHYFGITNADITAPIDRLFFTAASQKGLSLLKNFSLPCSASLADWKNTRFANLESMAADTHQALYDKMPSRGTAYRKKPFILK